MANPLFTYSVQIRVASTTQLTAEQVHEELCMYLHEECINFVPVCTPDAIIEFLDIGTVRAVKS